MRIVVLAACLLTLARTLSGEKIPSATTEGIQKKTDSELKRQNDIPIEPSSNPLEHCLQKHLCRICDYDEILSTQKCIKTGYLTVYQCPGIGDIVQTCDQESKVNRVLVFAVFFWILVVVCMRILKFQKAKIESQMFHQITKD